MWRFCGDRGIPTVAFVNGLDRERAQFERALESLEKMGASPAVLCLPIGTEASFSAGFRLDPERRSFGPHESPFAMPMRHQTLHGGVRRTRDLLVAVQELPHAGDAGLRCAGA